MPNSLSPEAAEQVFPTDPWEEARSLAEFLHHARQHGLESECLYYIIADLRQGESLGSAIWHASCEWDL